MPPTAAITGASIFELLVAVYMAATFGGGIGIMNLAMPCRARHD